MITSALKRFSWITAILLLLPHSYCGQPSTQLPDAIVKDLAGRSVSLNEFSGKPVIVNFWATWCGPCRFEIPMLNDLHKKYGSSDLVILGISTDEEGAEIVKPFMKDMPIHYPVYLATPGIEEKFGGIWGLPTTFFFDKNGKQIAKSFGLQPRSYFEEQIEQMIR